MESDLSHVVGSEYITAGFVSCGNNPGDTVRHDSHQCVQVIGLLQVLSPPSLRRETKPLRYGILHVLRISFRTILQPGCFKCQLISGWLKKRRNFRFHEHTITVF